MLGGRGLKRGKKDACFESDEVRKELTRAEAVGIYLPWLSQGHRRRKIRQSVASSQKEEIKAREEARMALRF